MSRNLETNLTHKHIFFSQMKLGKVAITFFAFAVVLGLAYALTFFGARGGSYEPDENYDSHVLLEKLEKSKKLEDKFYERQKLGNVTDADVDILDEAILILQDYITSSKTQDRDIHARLFKLRGLSQNIRGKAEAEEIARLALEADEAFTSQNMMLALDLYTKLKEKQQRLNKLYPDSEYYDVRRLAKAEQMLRLVSAAPLDSEIQDLQRQIDFAMKSKRWNEAQKLLQQAIEKQTYLNKEFASTSFANFSKVREFEVELDSLKAAPIESEIKEAVEKAGNLEKQGDFKAAAESYSFAYERQKELNLLFAKSKYSSDANLRKLENLRDTALSRDLYSQIEKGRGKLNALLLAGGASDEIPNLIGDLLVKCETLKKSYPASTLLSEDDVLSLRFLSYLGSKLPEINKLLNDSLLPIESGSSAKMLATEVPQKLYKMVMQENPSRNVGEDLPVETVSLENVQDFCRRLSWISAKMVRLPSRQDYYKAVGNLKYVDLNAISWNAGNSGMKTHKVATSEANIKGFYDLLGNVEEYATDDSKFGIIGGSSQTWTDSLGEVPYKPISADKRGDRMLGFRVVVEDKK